MPGLLHVPWGSELYTHSTSRDISSGPAQLLSNSALLLPVVPRGRELRIVQPRLQLFHYCLYPAGTRFILADVATETHKNNFPHLTTYQHFLIPGLAHSSAAAREEKK